MTDQFVPQNQQETDFFELCKKHDLTYNYSDDGRVWREGENSLQRIKVAARLLPQERAKEIWNAVVDLKVQTRDAEEFKWR